MDKPTNVALNAHSKHLAFTCKSFIKTFLKKWTRTNLHGNESRCVAFTPDQVKPHVLRLQTISFEKVWTTTVVRVNNALDVCQNACSKERFVIAAHLTEESKGICEFEILSQDHEE